MWLLKTMALRYYTGKGNFKSYEDQETFVISSNSSRSNFTENKYIFYLARCRPGFEILELPEKFYYCCPLAKHIYYFASKLYVNALVYDFC